VGGDEHVVVRVGDRHGTTDEFHALEVVHVVADVHDLRRLEAAFSEQLAEAAGLVGDPLLERQSELSASLSDDWVPLGRQHERVDPRAPQGLEPESVALVAGDPLGAIFADPHPVVRHDPVEIEDDEPEGVGKPCAPLRGDPREGEVCEGLIEPLLVRLADVRSRVEPGSPPAAGASSLHVIPHGGIGEFVYPLVSGLRHAISTRWRSRASIDPAVDPT
jgi:hypothetical protein